MQDEQESRRAVGLVLIRGGGDLASGIALRLHRAGLRLAISELEQPLAVRRTVAFSEAVYQGKMTIEGRTAVRASSDEIHAVESRNEIPVLVDPRADILNDARYSFLTVVDARMEKREPAPLPSQVPLHIGLGPGFHAGRDCDAVIETRRSHALGRVYWSGATQADSGLPEGDPRRVLRAPADGVVAALASIGDHVTAGQPVAEVGGNAVTSPFDGVLRGLIRPSLFVTEGTKIGDVDPRDDPAACYLVSDKALAVGGGVLEAILSRESLRGKLWSL